MMLLCIFKLSGRKNCKETLHLQQWQCILTLLHLHTIIIMQIILHSVDFARDKKKIFNFSDVCPLGHKSYFDLFFKKSNHGFYVLTSFLLYIALILSNKWSIDREKCKVSTPST